MFEDLFRPGEAPPDPSEIPGRVESMLDDAIRRLAPFLRASQWQVERRHFTAETIKAALAWRDVLARLGAEILASEAWLQGTWSGIPIHGQTDLLLGLPGDRLLVVDYKRSKSTSRRPAHGERLRLSGEPLPGNAGKWWPQGRRRRNAAEQDS